MALTEAVILPQRETTRTRDPINIIGTAPAMKRVHECIGRLAQSDITTLVYGETGTGKELVAASLHAHGPRSSGPLVCANCAALSDSLIDTELFGHVRGAFTGALNEHIGRFEAASGGTLFLDEIGDMSLWAQTRLLRVLETKCIERVGSHKSIPVNLRVIAATNRDLQADVQTGRFRADLFYRLCVATIHLPPLRERPGDIPLLAQHFLDRIQRPRSFTATSIAMGALEAMMRYPWPGNIRELRNAVEYASVHAQGTAIAVVDLPPGIVSDLSPCLDCDRRQGDRRCSIRAPVSHHLPHKKQQRFDSEALRQTLDQNHWHIGNTAAALDMHRTTLWRHMQRLGILNIRLQHSTR